MVTTDERPLMRLPGQNTGNPLLALLNGITPQQVHEIDDEIAVTRTYLDKLEKLRDVIGVHAPVVTVVAEPEPVRQPAAKAIATRQPEPPPEPEEEEEIEEEGEDEEEDEDEIPAKRTPAAAVPRGTNDNPQFKDLDEKRRTVAEYLFKKGYAEQRAILRDCKGVGGRNVSAILHHKWFERFKLGGDEVWRLTASGKSEGVEL